MKPAPAMAALALLVTFALVLAAPASATSTAAAYHRGLDQIDLQLRFAIELGPAELEGDVAFSERLCLTALAAEAAGETPSARIDRQGLEYVVRRHDLRLTKTIEGTLQGADRRVASLGDRFAMSRPVSPSRTHSLHRGVGEVRAGIAHLLDGLDRYRQGFHRLPRLDCAGAEADIESAVGPIRRGLVRVETGMGLLWLPAEP